MCRRTEEEVGPTFFLPSSSCWALGRIVCIIQPLWKSEGLQSIPLLTGRKHAVCVSKKYGEFWPKKKRFPLVTWVLIWNILLTKHLFTPQISLFYTSNVLSLLHAIDVTSQAEDALANQNEAAITRISRRYRRYVTNLPVRDPSDSCFALIGYCILRLGSDLDSM